MKEVFDWKAFGGCLIFLVISVAAFFIIPVIIICGQFLFFILVRYVLPLLGLLAMIAIAGYILWCFFKGMFFKKVE